MNNKFEFAATLTPRRSEEKRRLTCILQDELIVDFINERGDMPDVFVSRVGKRKKSWYFISSEGGEIRPVLGEGFSEVEDKLGRYIEVLGNRIRGNAYRFYFGTVEELVSFKG